MYQPLLDAAPSVPSVIGAPVKGRYVVTYQLIGMPEGVTPLRDYLTAFSAQQAMAAWLNNLGPKADSFVLVDVARVGERG